MKAWVRVALELLLIVLLLPQLFVFLYYFVFAFSGNNWLEFLKAMAFYALTISWVSAPFLVLLYALVRGLLGARVRWFVALPLCVGTGFFWLWAWNHFVYPAFTWGRAVLPLLACSVGPAGYAWARAMYLESLILPKPPAKEPSDAPTEKQAEGLSE